MNKAAKHSAILITAFIATSVLNYVFSVALSWFLQPGQFGVLGVAQSLLLLTALAVGSGFAWTVAQDFAHQGVTDVSRRRFRAAWIANICLGAILGAGLWLAYRVGWLRLGSDYRLIVPLVGATTVLLATRAVINGTARGLYLFSPVAINMIGDAALKAGIGLALVAAGAGVPGVMAAFTLATALALAHSVWVVSPARLWMGSGWIDPQVYRATAPLFLGMFGPALILNLDILGLKLFSPAGQGDQLAGLYQAAVILARTPVFFAQALILVLFSYVAGSTRTEDSAQVPGHIEAAMRAWMRLLLPIGLVLILAPRAALSLFFPPHYHQAILALRFAAAGGLFLALMTLLIGVFQASGNQRRPAAAAAIAGLIQVAILVVFVPRWGANAAALSLLLASCAGILGLSPGLVPYFRPLLAGGRSGLWVSLLKMGLPLVALSAPLLALPDGGRLDILWKFSLAGVAYLAALAIAYLKPFRVKDHQGEWFVVQFVNVLLGGTR